MTTAETSSDVESPLRQPEFRKLLAISITVALGFGMLIPILPLYAKSFGVGITAVGLVQFVFGLTRFSFGLVAGVAVDRFGERASTVTGILIVSASSFAAGLAQTFPQLVLARGFGGAGSALFIGGLMNRILRIIEPNAMGRATGAFRSSFLLGTGIGPVTGGVIAQRLGLTAPLFIYAAGLVAAATIAWFAMAGGPTVRRAERRSPLEALQAAKPLFGDIRYLAALAATLAGWWTVSGPAQTVASLFATQQLGFTKSRIGLAISLLAAGEFLALLVAGRLADRHGRRAVLVPSLAVMALATVALGRTAGAPWAFLALMPVIGAAIAASGTATGGLLGDSIPPGGSGAAVGVNQMAGDLGYLTAPVAVAWLAETTSFPTAYLVAAIPAAAVLLVAVKLPVGARAVPDARIEPAEPVG